MNDELRGEDDRCCDGVSRRDLLKVGVLSALGFGLSEFFCASAAKAAEGQPVGGAKGPAAEAVILIWLAGGPSHVDSWDPKPQASADIRGTFGSVPTKIPGVHLSEHLKRTAAMADELCLIRSMTSNQADHERGTHYMMTGFPPLPGFGVPSMGSVTSKMLGPRGALPPYIAVPSPVQYGGAGFLGAALDPFSPGGDPSQPGFRVRDLEPEGGLTMARVERRRSLRQAVDAAFMQYERSSDRARSVGRFYEAAYNVLSSPEARGAFDLSKEPAALRDSYGRNGFGQGCLLARRLIEGGVRFVTVQNGGWDTHVNGFSALSGKLPVLDQGYTALLSDLKQRGLLQKTLVLVMGEFGRTPHVNAQGGRDHYPHCFSVALAGGGIKGGAVIGSSDETGSNPAERPVKPEDLTATVYERLGIDYTANLESPEGIRIVLSRGGEPVREAMV